MKTWPKLHSAYCPAWEVRGGSAAVADLGIRMYFLHKAFPETVSSDYTLRAANYMLGHTSRLEHIVCIVGGNVLQAQRVRK